MIKKLLASVAAAGLMVAPIAAQAGTRSADAGVSLSSVSRAGAPVGAAEADVRPSGARFIWWFGGFITVAALLALLLEKGKNNRSPGT